MFIEKQILVNTLALLEELKSSKKPMELWAWAQGEDFLIEQTIGDLKDAIENPHSITIIVGDDWSGLYIDGELYMQGHNDYVNRFSLEKVIAEISSDVTITRVEKDQDWFDEQGGYCPEILPEDLI